MEWALLISVYVNEEESLPEFYPLLDRLISTVPVYMTLSYDDLYPRDLEELLRKKYPQMKLDVIKNRGFDAGALLYSLPNLWKYKYVLRLRSLRDTSLVASTVHALCGTPYRVQRVIDIFNKNSCVGLIGIEDSLITYSDEGKYFNNLYYVKTLCEFYNIPKTFDWKFYLSKYPDLGRAGIKTKEQAVNHYINYGYKEGRQTNEENEIKFQSSQFISNGMFWFRTEAFQRIFFHRNPLDVYKSLGTLEDLDWHWYYLSYNSKVKWSSQRIPSPEMKDVICQHWERADRSQFAPNAYKAREMKMSPMPELSDGMISDGYEIFWGHAMISMGYSISTLPRESFIQRYKIKPVAIYFPQFHEVEENNKFWGKGYTDWVRLKDASPFAPGLILRKPHPDFGYYDLTETHIRDLQGKVAKKYGVYGFCFYHYWFQGRKVMYKPLEAMLQDGAPDIPFCLEWANEPWTRRWDGLNHDVLLAQDYGNVDDWTRHFNYLLPFFKHKNYITVEKNPIFLIYRCNHIGWQTFQAMSRHFKKLAISNGLPGLYIIAVINSFGNEDYAKISDGCMQFEPMYSWRFVKGAPPLTSKPHHHTKYKDIWERILKCPRLNRLQFRGAFTGWDNSTRSPGRPSSICSGISPQLFNEYLIKQIDLIIRDPNTSENLLFITAWNEWTVQSILEPDASFGYGMLEALRDALDTFK